jgi:hypothetical protein
MGEIDHAGRDAAVAQIIVPAALLQHGDLASEFSTASCRDETRESSTHDNDIHHAASSVLTTLSLVTLRFGQFAFCHRIGGVIRRWLFAALCLA